MTKAKKTVKKGNHLTVTTHPTGRTELKWDWDALVKEVIDAIADYESGKSKPVPKTKKTSTSKKKIDKIK